MFMNSTINDVISVPPLDLRTTAPYELRRGAEVYVMTPLEMPNGITGYQSTLATVTQKLPKMPDDQIVLRIENDTLLCHRSRVFATRRACALEVETWNNWLIKIHRTLPTSMIHGAARWGVHS